MSREVAETIIGQLGGQGRLKAMLGASSFSAGQFEGGPGLSFRISAKAKFGVKALIITLNARDLYDVEFKKMRGFDCVTVNELRNVDCEQLKPMIEDKLGLRLSL